MARNPRDNFPFPTYEEVLDAWGQYWTDWLYGSPMSETKYKEYLVLSQIPVLNSGIQYAEGLKQANEYLQNNHMTWNEVHHPSKLPGSSAMRSGVAGSLNFVSSNIKRLYR